MALLLTDLEQLGLAALQEFNNEMVQAHHSPDVAKEAQRFEAKLEQLYAVAATMAQREESLDSVAAIWAGMVSICDRMAQALTDLQVRSALPESYDRILDIRNACEENRALHA